MKRQRGTVSPAAVPLALDHGPVQPNSAGNALAPLNGSRAQRDHGYGGYGGSHYCGGLAGGSLVAGQSDYVGQLGGNPSFGSAQGYPGGPRLRPGDGRRLSSNIRRQGGGRSSDHGHNDLTGIAVWPHV